METIIFKVVSRQPYNLSGTSKLSRNQENIKLVKKLCVIKKLFKVKSILPLSVSSQLKIMAARLFFITLITLTKITLKQSNLSFKYFFNIFDNQSNMNRSHSPLSFIHDAIGRRVTGTPICVVLHAQQVTYFVRENVCHRTSIPQRILFEKN